MRTFDPANAARAVIGSLSKNEPVALLRWDIVRGIGHINEAGKAVVAQLVNGQNPEMIGPSDALGLGARLPEGCGA